MGSILATAEKIQLIAIWNNLMGLILLKTCGYLMTLVSNELKKNVQNILLRVVTLR